MLRNIISNNNFNSKKSPEVSYCVGGRKVYNGIKFSLYKCHTLRSDQLAEKFKHFFPRQTFGKIIL